MKKIYIGLESARLYFRAPQQVYRVCKFSIREMEKQIKVNVLGNKV